MSSPADGKSCLQVRNGAGVVVTTLAVVSVFGAILLAGSPSGAWAEEAARIDVIPASAAPGATVMLHGSGWPAGAALVAQMYQASNVGGPGASMSMAFQADGAGSFSVEATVPHTLFGAGSRGSVEVVPGAYTIVVRAGSDVSASAPFRVGQCAYVLGFRALHEQIAGFVGDCLTDEFHVANGDGLQITTGPVGPADGLMVWRKADNWTAYTDGYRTWVNGPLGLQTRLNTERFSWEPDA